MSFLMKEQVIYIYISEEINFNNLIYYFNGSSIAPINIIAFKGPMRIRNEIINGDTTIEKTEKDQNQFKSKLNEITTGNQRHKSIKQLDIIKNVKNLYNSRQKVIDLFNDYTKIKSEAMYKKNVEQDLKY